uniref:Cadherin_C domain-containing protein n=2 Tax=Mesocestoides corti TaxID=53468 RepID=A0A5K3FQJ2_MESCO
MPVGEQFPTDRSTRVFSFTPEDDNNLLFAVNDEGLLYLITASPPGERWLKAEVTTKFQPTLKTATSQLQVYVHWLPGSGLMNGLLFRISKATLLWFVRQSSPLEPTPRDRLVSAMSKQLGVSEEYITMFPVKSLGNNFDVFVGIHASPYEVPGRLIDTLINDVDLYNTALRGSDDTLQAEVATSIHGVSGPAVLKCDSEAASVSACGGRGCRSLLSAPTPPTTGSVASYGGLLPLVPGASTFGPQVRPSIDCWCNGDDPTPSTQAPTSCLDANACLNGGFCSELPGTQTTTCECQAGFSGPRCEQTQVYFNDGGYAWAPAIGGCTRLHIRFAFKTGASIERSGLLLYAGPISQSVSEMRSHDFIGLQLESGGRRLKLAYSLGSAGVRTAEFSSNARLDDTNWHEIDLLLTQTLAAAEVILTLDSCRSSEGLDQVNGLEKPPNLQDCLFRLPYHVGTRRALNVGQWPLQLGGRKHADVSKALYPAELTTNSLPSGSSIRRVVVNGELWNLAQFNLGSNALPGPSVCLNSKGLDVCAPNGVCVEVNGSPRCQCNAGFQEKGLGCRPSAYSVELGPSPSYLELTAKTEWIDQPHTEVSFGFRTRSAAGTLVYLSGPEPNYYQNSSFDVRLSNTRLEVVLNLGDFNALTASPARSQLNDGAWHHVHIHRSLSSIFVEIDGAAGKGHSAFLPINTASNFFKMSIGKKVLIGARRDLVPGAPSLADGEVRPASSSIGSTCLRDLRVNGAWYPLSQAEVTAAGTAGHVVSMKGYGDNLDSCSDLTACPADASCPGDLTCVPTWKPQDGYKCLCPSNCVQGEANRCFCLAVCSLFPCLNGGTCQPSSTDSRGFKCDCPTTHFGLFCEAEVMRAGLSVGAFTGIVIAIFAVLGLIIGVVVWRCYRKRTPPQLSPDKDLREHVMPYFEQADEIDTHSFDEGRLAFQHPPQMTQPSTWAGMPTFLFDLLDSTTLTVAKSRTNTTGTGVRTSTTSPGDARSTSFQQVLNAQLKTKPIEVPDYTLDYGYEGGNTSAEEDEVERDNYLDESEDSRMRSMSSSGFQDQLQPFGDTFDALDQLTDGAGSPMDAHRSPR